jgi:hypothetical protein
MLVVRLIKTCSYLRRWSIHGFHVRVAIALVMVPHQLCRAPQKTEFCSEFVHVKLILIKDTMVL